MLVQTKRQRNVDLTATIYFHCGETLVLDVQQVATSNQLLFALPDDGETRSDHGIYII